MTTDTSTPVTTSAWLVYIGPFAAAIGKSPEDVATALKGLVGEPGQPAIDLLKDSKFTPDADIIGAVGAGVPKAVLMKAIAGLRGIAPADPSVSSMGTANLDVLPPVPSDDAWLNSLKVGGVLKFNKDTVIGTVSAALAHQVGLYDLPPRIITAMEKQAVSLEEPVGAEFYEMQAMLTRRSYSEIFAAMPGVTGQFATETRKKELLRRINERMWPSFISFQQQLANWVTAWQQSQSMGMSSPAALVSAIRAMNGGGGALPPGMMQPPPTDPLRDAAETVVRDINYVFAGTGIPVAMALAYDAQQIRKALENPGLPAQVGAANREQMLRQLGVAVSSDYPRLERSLKQYALGIIELPNVTPGDAELTYVGALFTLGSMIPWDKLEAGSGNSGIGGRRPGQL